MIGCLVTLVSIAAVVVSFFSPAAAWGTLALPAVFLLWMLASAKGQKLKHVPQLSPMANRLLQRYGHFYAMPSASRDFSSASSGVQLASAAIGIIGAIKGSWWGIPLAVVTYFVMAAAAKQLNPSLFLENPAERAAHDEIIDYMTKGSR
jgi:hypothetical protein